MSEPAYLNRELGLIEAERINRLLGLRFKYLVSIPIAVGVGYLADIAGASEMLSVTAFVGTQVIYGALLALHEIRKGSRAS